MEERCDRLTVPVSNWSGRRNADIVVIGAGIAGLAFALRLSERHRVIVITKGVLGESNTRYAQGGLTAAVGSDDHPDLHFADTIAAGAGLCDDDAVRILVAGGPEAVRWLLERGARFDLDHRGQEGVALGREAAHSRNRVLHAGGDAIGAEIERALVSQLRVRAGVTILERTVAVDLVTSDSGVCVGVIVQPDSGGDRSPDRTILTAPVTVLANGGAGQLWAVTSNPPDATGDGVAMAIRSGAAVADLEFTQFHPTVLTGNGYEPFLISKAVRGEGAYLRSRTGERFMLADHPMAELAPRDVVARAIQRQIARDGDIPVSLDLRHLDPGFVRRRFPTIARHLADNGLDLAIDLVPVAPAAHFFMGGVVADTFGATSIPGLLALGEVSCTGVHGANRLASNSLLEGLVFGLRAADRINESTIDAPGRPLHRDAPVSGSRRAPIPDGPGPEIARHAVREIMSAEAAVVRSATSLTNALAELAAFAASPELDADTRSAVELRNLLLLAREVTRSALARAESRGAHFREDAPDLVPELDGRHQIVHPERGVFHRSFGPLAARSVVSHAR